MEYHPVAHRHQHSPYGVQLREAVVYMYFTLGYSEVAFHFGGHPNRDTVSRIVKDYLQQGEVVAPAGGTGVIHATRKFDALAWETLLYLVQADSQSTLYGEHMPCNTCMADLGLYGRTLWRCQSFHDVHHDM